MPNENVIITNLGRITAYADAVSAGYIGTREQFAQDQAKFAENAQIARQSADSSKSYAVGGTGTREGEDTDNAKYYCESVKTRAEEIIQLEEEAIKNINNTKDTAIGVITDNRQAAVENIETDKVSALSAISTDKADALGAISASKTDATGAISTDKTEAISAINTTKEQAIQSLDGYVEEAESFAHGGTGTRPDEDVDNASYYSQKSKEYMEQAKSIVDVGFASDTHSGLAKGDGVGIHANPDEGGKLSLTEKYSTHPDMPVSSVEGAHGLRFNESTETIQRFDETTQEWEDAGAKIDIDDTISEDSTNPVQNKVIKSYVDGEIEKVQLYKFPNATIVGQPTINNGQISNFSQANYLRFPFIVNFQGRPFEINTDFTTGANVTAQENIFDSDFGFAFAVRSGRLVIALSSNGTSWNIGEGVGSLTITPNTSYMAKLSWDGTTYKVAVSTNGGESYTDDISVSSSESLYPKQVFIGIGQNGLQVLNAFSGIINLNYCDLTISNKLVWQGMDDVGLATRLAVDLSNIDDAGKQKIKEISNLVFGNVRVTINSFVLDSTYEDYPYRSDISLVGVTSNSVPTVNFGMDEAISGNFSPIAVTADGVISIYSNSIPLSEFVIPSIVCVG